LSICSCRLSSLPRASPKPPAIISSKTHIKCHATSTHTPETRRSGNYPPSAWDYDLVKSFQSNYTEEKYVQESDMLKNEVRGLINKAMDPLAKLELIEAVQRLGLKYQFEMEIKNAIETLHKESKNSSFPDDLYSTALQFRLFRQHGYDVPQVEEFIFGMAEVFRRFMDDKGGFKASLSVDVKGLVNLYEASFFGYEGENIIDEAKAFATSYLKDSKGELSPSMARKVSHALELPLHWRLQGLEARWFIDTYEHEPNMDPNLLRFAKLDYNVVQSIHQQELRELARWWTNLGLEKNVNFSRDRLMEHYLWVAGMVFEPQYGEYRHMATKVIQLITVIDDIYDVYGSVEELELLTDFVDRWDISEIDKLPNSIKTCLLAVYNTTNEIGYWTIQKRNFNIIPYFSKECAKLCKAYLKEAKWYHGGYKPTLKEYFDNAVISVAAPLMLFCSYFLTTKEITKEALDYIDKLPSIVYCGSMLLRLTNDLGTAVDELARGDVLKAVQCYMNDTGASEEVGRDYINHMIHDTWKILNKDVLIRNYPFGEPFISANPNLGRTTTCFYQYGDGHGIQPNSWIKDNLTALFVDPVPLD
ncbi:Terpene synthase, metal-binding domain, partial [Dillenia turbinata]